MLEKKRTSLSQQVALVLDPVLRRSSVPVAQSRAEQYTTIESLPRTVSARAEVAIPGYYLAHARNPHRPRQYLLRRVSDGTPVALLHIGHDAPCQSR
jgi:hypothetical protein